MRTGIPDHAVALLSAAAVGYGCSFAALAAIAEVESGRWRDDEAKRLKVTRFEPRVWRRNGGGLIASEAAAKKVNPALWALASSHGVFQILGENARSLGYGRPGASKAEAAEAMVKAFTSGTPEQQWAEQVRAFLRYIEINGMVTHLRAMNIHELSRIYNGSNYEAGRYHLKLSYAYSVISGKAPARVLKLGNPDRAAVEKLQQALQALRLYKGRIDGAFGPDTEEAVRAFQGAQGLKADGVVGALTWGALGLAAEPEAVEEIPTRREAEGGLAETFARAKEPLAWLLGGIAAFRREVASWAETLGIDLAAMAERAHGALANITPEQALLAAVLLLLLWREFSPRLRRGF